MPLEIILTENIPENLNEILPPDSGLIRIIKNKEPKGFAENHNHALQDARGRIFCVLNPDTRLSAGTLLTLSQEATLRGGIVGPVVIDPSGRKEDNARRLPTLTRLICRRFQRRRGPDYCDSAPAVSVDWLAGMCLVLTRDLYSRLGGFDTRYRLYCEDVDICLRSHLCGEGVWWIGAARVTHDARRASWRSTEYAAMHVASLLKLFTSQAYWQFRSACRTR